MKNKYFKTSLSLFLSLSVVCFGLPNVSAGGKFSKCSKPTQPARESLASILVSKEPFKYIPINAEDGGKTYFEAWNGSREKNGFTIFAKKYRNVKNNIKSAKLLPNSKQNEKWMTVSTYGNVYTLEFFEELEDPDRSKYLLRIDEKNNLIYTVRKSENLYLFTFYKACSIYGKAMLCRSCFVVSSDIRNIKQLLLPVDKELLN